MATAGETEDVYHSAEEGDGNGLDTKFERLELKSEGISSEDKPVGTLRPEGSEENDSSTASKLGTDEQSANENAKEEEELTEEQKEERLEQGNDLKKKGNEHYKSEEYELAMDCYTEALSLYPSVCLKEVSVAHGNLAACWLKLNEHEKVIGECTKALDLDDKYLKALLRRAQSYESTDKLESAFEDYKRALELDPTAELARHACTRLPDQIKEQQEKMKTEMMGKLKDLGDAILKPFGLSTNNFQFQQDANTGGYSVNFQK